ncbi:MAG: hypothetical protein KH972_07265 [Peptostreptococcaceae bacterium]|nr:hypothetical protein [Peptostreptococcaceae bacterium]
MEALMEIEKTTGIKQIQVQEEEKKEIEEIVTAIKGLPKSARTKIFYMTQGAQLIVDSKKAAI